MKQAGEGADYLEGCEGARSQRCFKCGGTGHWAAECKGLEVRTPCLAQLSSAKHQRQREYPLTYLAIRSYAQFHVCSWTPARS